MVARRSAWLSLSLLLLFCPLASAQESPQPELAARLRELLRQYESNIADLKGRIAELETRLADSEARSTSLLEELSASREALSGLTSRYDRLETQLDEYQTRLEDSKRRTTSSLDSLTASMASVRRQEAIQTGAALVLLIAAIALAAR